VLENLAKRQIFRWRGKIYLFADRDNFLSNTSDTLPAGSPHGEAVGRQGETYSFGVKTKQISQFLKKRIRPDFNLGFFG